MGGSQQPSYQIPAPNSTLQMAELGNLSSAGNQSLANRNALLLQGAKIPIQPFTPDLFGGGGAATQAGMISAIDAFKNKQLEQQQNAPAAAAREQLMQAAQEDVSPDYWNKQMANYAKTTGLQSQLASGLGDSTIGKSALYDKATAQGQVFRNANLGQAQQIIGNAPTGGYIDPASAISAQQAAQAQNAQGRSNLIGGVYQGAQANQQSATDWINQMMGASSQAISANQANWQNYQQAMMNQAAQSQASNNMMSGLGIGALGGLGGSMLGSSGGSGSGGSSGGIGGMLGGSGGSSGGSKGGGWGGAASGALSGATTGGTIGGPYGAAIGALAGGTMGYFA
jgi:hypothetical protein